MSQVGKKRLKLGVNVDHVATIRQARGTFYPDPVEAALLAQAAGADGITVHLREDRRHIQSSDVSILKEKLNIPLNLEMALVDEMIEFALNLAPEKVCLVPEKREELTTEGGLNVIEHSGRLAEVCRCLAKRGIEVSIFIDPDPNQIQAVNSLPVPVVELHTGSYAEARATEDIAGELSRIEKAASCAAAAGLVVNAGHGLHIKNVQSIAALLALNELNIGHSLIARALFIGLPAAVKEMKSLMDQARAI